MKDEIWRRFLIKLWLNTRFLFKIPWNRIFYMDKFLLSYIKWQREIILICAWIVTFKHDLYYNIDPMHDAPVKVNPDPPPRDKVGISLNRALKLHDKCPPYGEDYSYEQPLCKWVTSIMHTSIYTYIPLFKYGISS
jgi:hypothetical protein